MLILSTGFKGGISILFARTQRGLILTTGHGVYCCVSSLYFVFFHALAYIVLIKKRNTILEAITTFFLVTHSDMLNSWRLTFEANEHSSGG